MKFIKCSVFAVLCALSFSGFSGDSSDLRARLNDFTLPEYNTNGELQYVVYGKQADFKGVIVDFKNILVNLVRKDIKNVMSIGDLSGLKIYPIDEKLDKVKDFWKKINHSRALIETKEGKFDRITKTIKGDGKIKLRSPQMDIDGVGFDADYANKTIFIKSKVKVVLRMNGGGKK